MNSIINDIYSLSKHVVDFFCNVDYYYFIFIMLTAFFYQKKENNYVVFPLFVLNVFKISSLYRYVRYSFIITLSLLIFQHYKHSFIIEGYKEYKYSTYLLDSVNCNILQYLVLNVVVTYLVFLLFKKKLKQYILSSSDLRYGKYNFTYIKYLIFTTISFLLNYLTLFIFTYSFSKLDSIMLNNNYYPIEIYSSENIKMSYHRGVYISVIASLIVVSLLFNAIVKSLFSKHSIQDILIYMFILIIVSLGCYSGFYSISNYILNIREFGTNSEWLKNDKLIGYYSVRITSLILLWSINKFVFKTVFKNNFYKNFIYALFPIEPNKNETRNLGQFSVYYTNNFDSIYFSQVGYYILNVFNAEYLLSNLNIDIFTSLLIFILPIMVDDFFVIHVYHKKTNSIDNWHIFKLYGFNALLFIASTLTLYMDNHFVILSIYSISSFVLLYFGYIRHR